MVSGQIGATIGVSSSVVCNLSTSTFDLHKLVTQFWEIEEVEGQKALSPDELECEKAFNKTTRRDVDGRFIVTLPLKQLASSLGESRVQAERRFYSTERKFQRNATLRKRYVAFMKEYAALNHMSLLENESPNCEVEYFMPHHGVLCESSLTTKLRVVFDASAPSSNSLSLNNLQIVGPVLQDDLLSILLRFRKHAVVVSADVAKMYREVLVQRRQRVLQTIVWREDPSQPLRVYVLSTVTYGQASASYLAVRCLFELAEECESSYPEIARIIRNDFYVDDLITGAEIIK